MDAGQKLGKYELLELVGKGAMGVVFRARDPDIERTVAIKTVRKELIEDDERAGMVLARFKNEARAAGRLSHPGIVAVYDYGESDTVAYIAMEFVQGNSLREYFNTSTRFAEPDILSIMVQLLEALAHAHEQGVWHRDIKPANLIVMKSGRVKVADFGIARIESSQLTQTGMLMGSQGYMAPEQYGGGRLDRRVDLFAAGVVLYQLLTAARPFTGTTEQIVYRICHEQPAAPSAADPGKNWERYDAVVARALAKKPDERFQSALEFRDALLAAYGAPVSASVSEETIVALPVRPGGVFEPSNPSWRTPAGSGAPLPPARGDPPAAAAGKGAGAFAHGLGAKAIAVAAVVAATVGGVLWRKAEPPAQQALAPTEAPAVVAPPAPVPAAAREAKTPEPTTTAKEKPAQPPAPAQEAKIAEPPPAPQEKPAPAESPAAEEAPAEVSPPPRARAQRRAAARAERRREASAAAPDDAPATAAAPAAEANASVLFSITPRGAVVFVNGERRGTVPPLSALQLAPGDYHVEIQHGKSRPYVSDINLRPGDRLRIQYSFR
jgi:serine/threonine-protein kinase